MNKFILIFIFIILITSFFIPQYDASAKKKKPFDVKHDAQKAIGKDGKNVIIAECPPEPEVEEPEVEPQIVGEVVQMENGKYALLAPGNEPFKEKPIDSLSEQGVYSTGTQSKYLDDASLAEEYSLSEEGVYSTGTQSKYLDDASLAEVDEGITYGTNKGDFIISSPETTATFCGLIIDAKKGNDEVQGGWGNDIIYGKDGDDTLQGSDGNDQIYGGNGYDRLVGGFGSNLLYGERGDDQLFGGDGDDQIAGGVGADTFYCGSGIDEIKDYNTREGDNIIDKGGGLEIGDEVGCEIGVGADFNFGTTQSGDLSHKNK